MALSADVLVIGGGMAGAAAALSARASGASVLLVARGPGATALSSGAADIAAVGDLPLREAAHELARRGGHPYALIDDLDSAVAEALKLLASLGYAGSGERNLWLLSPLGRAKPAALAQAAIAAGDLRALPRDARPAVVALAGAQAIEARLQAAGLRRFFEKAFSLPVDFFVHKSDALKTVPEMARDIDARRGELAAALRKAALRSGATHLFMPTLGLSPQELEAGVPVFEMISAPPSVPGLRLQRALDESLKGIVVRNGIAEKSAQGGVQIISGTSCEPVDAGAIVLATGRFIGGGIRSDSRLRETVFDLPAWAGERQSMPALASEELFAQRARGRHAGLSAGLRVGPGMRVQGELPIFAAGAVVGGYDQSRDEGGIGAAALLGIAAGRSAAAGARRAEH